jgi:hypothetical protein
MEKVYNKIDLKFENDYLILLVDNQLIKLKLADISSKLALATDKERNSYKITPSGYGIHWNLLDEDLSINGLLKKAK